MRFIEAARAGTFRSLRVRNYRLFFTGQLASLIGTWMQTVALGWLVYEITGSPTQIGTVLAAQFLPTLLGSMHGGLVADRFDRRTIIMCTQAALGLQALAMAVITLSGAASLPVLYALSLIHGVITTIDNPARQSFASELVGPEDLANAVSLNSAVFNSARILGPAIGGVLINVVGAGVCFAANAVSFLAVLWGLARMRPDELLRAAPAKRAKGQLREGVRYAWEEPTLRVVLSMVALVGLLAMNFNVVLPVVAKEVFGGDAGTYGFMSAAMGVGSLVGALVAASRSRPDVQRLAGSAVAFGCALTAAALAPTLPIAIAALALTGLCSITFNSGCNTLIQLASRPDMRGRTIALKTLFNLGSTPVGGPMVGWLGEQYGARWSLGVGGASCLVAGVGGFATLRGRRVVRAAAPEVVTADASR